MQVREKTKLNDRCYSSNFNTQALAEVICCWDDGSRDSMFIKDLDIFIESCYQNESCDIRIGWKDMRQALKDHDIITDNFNTCFFEPTNEIDRKREFTL